MCVMFQSSECAFMDLPVHIGAQRTKIGAEQLRHHVDPLIGARMQHMTLEKVLWKNFVLNHDKVFGKQL